MKKENPTAARLLLQGFINTRSLMVSRSCVIFRLSPSQRPLPNFLRPHISETKVFTLQHFISADRKIHRIKPHWKGDGSGKDLGPPIPESISDTKQRYFIKKLVRLFRHSDLNRTQLGLHCQISTPLITACKLRFTR